jgi:transcriptional regulator with XRE-family HTH domain
MEKIGVILREQRKLRNYTQKDMARLLKISQSKYSEIENGKAELTASQVAILSVKFQMCLIFYLFQTTHRGS